MEEEEEEETVTELIFPEEADVDASLTDSAAILVDIGLGGGGGDAPLVAEEETAADVRENSHGREEFVQWQ